MVLELLGQGQSKGTPRGMEYMVGLGWSWIWQDEDGQ